MAAMKLFSCVLLMITITMGIAGHMAEAQATQCDYPCADKSGCLSGQFCVRYGECNDNGWCTDDPCDSVEYCYNETDCVEARNGQECCEPGRCGRFPHEGYCC